MAKKKSKRQLVEELGILSTPEQLALAAIQRFIEKNNGRLPKERELSKEMGGVVSPSRAGQLKRLLIKKGRVIERGEVVAA